MADLSKMLADLLRTITSVWFTLLFYSYLNNLSGTTS